MTTTVRRSHLLLAGLTAAMGLTACAQTSPAGSSASPSPGATGTPQAVRALQTCFGAAPAGWAGAQRASLLTMQFDSRAVAPSGDRVYGSYQTTAGERGVAAVDLTSGALTRLVVLPAGSAGVLELAADPPWLAWVEATGQVNPGGALGARRPQSRHGRAADAGQRERRDP